MKKKYNLIAVFLMILAGSNAFSQYYYSANQQQSLSVDTTKVSILFSDGFTFYWDDFFSDHPQIDSQIYTGFNYDEFYFFSVTADNYYLLIDSLILDSRVALVNPYFQIGPDEPMLVGRTICCKFNDNVTIDIIDSLNEVYHVEIVYEREYTPNQFLLEVRKDAALSTLDIANIYYNLDETEFCHPNFLGGYEYHNYDIIDYYWEGQWAMHRIFESPLESSSGVNL